MRERKRKVELVNRMRMDIEKARHKPLEDNNNNSWLPYITWTKEMQKLSAAEIYRLEVDTQFAEGYVNFLEDLEKQSNDFSLKLRPALKTFSEVADSVRLRSEGLEDVAPSEMYSLKDSRSGELRDALDQAKKADVEDKQQHDAHLKEMQAENAALLAAEVELQAQIESYKSEKAEKLAEQEKLTKEIEELFYTMSHAPTFQGASDAKGMIEKANKIGVMLPSY